MTKTQKRINNLIGLIIGIVASAVYIMTAEPTVSWWDCGEYIATTSKMLIGHPPSPRSSPAVTSPRWPTASTACRRYAAA